MSARQRPPAPVGVRVRRRAVEELRLRPPLVAPDGSVPLATFQVARTVAARLRSDQPTGGPAAPPATARPSAVPPSAAELAAMGLLDEVLRRVVARYREQVRPDAFEVALRTAEERAGAGPTERTLEAVRSEFHPPADVAPPSPPDATLEDLLHVWLANANPALARYRALVDDRRLARATAYAGVVDGTGEAFRALPPFGPDNQSLVDLLRAPALASPGSLSGQLRYIGEHWGHLVGDLLDRLLVHLDVLVEEELATWRRFHPFGGGHAADSAAALGDALAGLGEEPERFSSDSAWMPRVVLMAKSTYVWLDQLSRQYGRDIRTLDAIPDEELDRLAHFGITGLWLIGLWERSRASAEIKRRRGNAEAVASAYSLDDYRIADDLGGEGAWWWLRERAWARGIRLASDMVPNHMGIDSRWVIEHPERFLSLPEPPYPSYSFNGPDLSPDARVRIAIDDHYWDDSDAAVVFLREDRGSGERRFIYHGNDGTSFPWNDTAQLNYLDAATREAVIRTILDVARRFPIIRFDAAMTLAKRHVERLWFPEPGAGGAIPSRAEHAMPKAEFNRLMPVEFWREVVDRVAAEAPDTLLLAEAFWLMEGYFVRTLGMHRVYNSAFMHMLRDEDNAGYRRVMRDTLEFDPEILKRYVNFMTNPDERTAVEQFGKGDKYFGVATVLATLPGLPMLGHGQLEGFGEKYGMEYRRAYRDEAVDEGLLAYHERTIVPLLHRRAQFAEVRDFLLYDVAADGGGVAEDVFAYSNVGPGGERSLVVYHNRFGSMTGWVRDARGRTLADGWRLPESSDAYVLWRDQVTGLEHLAPARQLGERGLRVELGAYERRVLLEVRDVRDGSARLWSRLWERLGTRGVPSLDDELRQLALEPVHAPLRMLVGGPMAVVVRSGRAPKSRSLTDGVRGLVDAVAETTSTGLDREAVVRAGIEGVEGMIRLAASPGRSPVASAIADPWHRAVLASWAILAPLGRLAPGDPVATSRAWFDELRLEQPITVGLRETGLDEGDAWGATTRLRLLLDLPRPSTVGGRSRPEVARRLVGAWLDRSDVRSALGVNVHEGVEWYGRERWRELLDWALLLDLVDPTVADATRSEAVAIALAELGERSGWRLDRLRDLVAARKSSARSAAPSARAPRRPATAPRRKS
ncbi:MAG TPA: alpha-amylase family glycosyl hydrolase [Candidatus Limnocylindrales bacterium]|nr:alpha-amylase family glycosyl hydrolase [Candidatus Limnocylindrales bacterium]